MNTGDIFKKASGSRGPLGRKGVSKLKILRKGFTLVELLIVISLLGAIALIVIAAINPVEQANRARDTQFKGDASQLVSALNRYFAANQHYPWQDTSGSALTPDSSWGYVTSHDQGVGICATAGAPATMTNGQTTCSADGLLITKGELLSAFRFRNFITSSAVPINTGGADKLIWIGKDASSAGTASQSVYACFIPLSASVRNAACTSTGTTSVYTLNTSGVRTNVTYANCSANTWSGTNWYYVCVPQ